jgi:hypothetical protein
MSDRIILNAVSQGVSASTQDSTYVLKYKMKVVVG